MTETGSNRMRSSSGFSPRTHRTHSTDVQRRTGTLTSVVSLLFVTTIGLGLQALPAHSQVMSNYVSGTGKDGNSCTSSAPCQTLQRALNNTLAGGQVITLDSANY